MDIESLYELFLRNPSIQTDTRRLKPGDMFFALKGDQFNGNQFAQQAVDAGAACAVIDEKEFAIEGKTILVENVLKTLQALARHHREQFAIPFIAITGSNGKTTTKELVHAVLSTKYNTATTEGNLNNHIGIPLTLLKIKAEAEIAVIEMGANHLLEIAGYCEYAKPDYGVITNCGKAHLGGFGGKEGVRRGKGELFDYLRTQGGTAFVMWDYDYLRDMSHDIPRLIKYGTADADLEGHALKSEPFLEVEITKGAGTGLISTRLVGDYNLPNVLLAVTIGKHFDVPDELIKSAIENYQPSNSRSQLLQHGTNQIILDAYNANPSSMKLAIENFARLQAPSKVLMLGAMAELGKESPAEHQEIVDLIGQTAWKQVVLVGEDFLKIPHPYISFSRTEEAKNWFQQQSFENTHILIKGSRSMKMEKILEP
ncbi:MAG: UDP-N-acetylmuramoyl-tripeptide--D-alanyl-D-alanine ligase [Sphingobacteriales bacterium]|nr:UDP-N-acetylmuramoyl-tripeptide--D-alanyl-D-alanine ligase [Sphingobacteriales bacterium]